MRFPGKVTTVAVYARISTREGKQHLQNQLRELRAYCARMAWEIVGTFTDQQSADSRSRPGLDGLMKAAARREFEAVVVVDLSRLTRGGPMKAFEFINRLKNSGVEFWSMNEEHFRTTGPAGELFIAIAAAIAKMEVETLRARIRAGLETARRRGIVLGSQKMVVDLARVHKLRKQGKSLREVADELGVSHMTIKRRLKQHGTKTTARKQQ
jgi:DNA invertase Pin-like site-specific DNA recombinase